MMIWGLLLHSFAAIQGDVSLTLPPMVQAQLACVRPATNSMLYFGTNVVWSENGTVVASPELSWPYRLRWNSKGDQAIVDDQAGVFLLTDRMGRLEFRKLALDTVAAWRGDSLIQWSTTGNRLSLLFEGKVRTAFEWQSVRPLACSDNGDLLFGRKNPKGMARTPAPHMVVFVGAVDSGSSAISYHDDSDDSRPTFVESLGSTLLVGAATTHSGMLDVKAFDFVGNRYINGRSALKWIGTLPGVSSIVDVGEAEIDAYVPAVPVVAGSLLLLPVHVRRSDKSFLLVFANGKYLRSVKLSGAYVSSTVFGEKLRVLYRTKEDLLRIDQLDIKSWRIGVREKPHGAQSVGTWDDISM